jgi:hypothetical protein
MATSFCCARPDFWTSLQTFETRDLFAQFAVQLFQCGDVAKQFDQQSLKFWEAQPGKTEWRRHIPVENRPSRAGAREKSGAAHTFAPLTGGDVATRAHWQIGLAYAKSLSPKFHLWCNTVVRERSGRSCCLWLLRLKNDQATAAFAARQSR